MHKCVLYERCTIFDNPLDAVAGALSATLSFRIAPVAASKFCCIMYHSLPVRSGPDGQFGEEPEVEIHAA